MIEKTLLFIGHTIIRSPRMTTFCVVALTLIAASLWPGFQFETDLSRLLPADNPAVQLGRQLEEETTNARVMLIELRGDRLEEDLPRLVGSLRASPYVESVSATREEFLGESSRYLEQAPLYYLPDETLARLAQRLSPEPRRAALEESRERLATDPLAAREVVLQDPLGLRWIIQQGVADVLPFALEPGTRYVVLASGKRAVLRLVGKTIPYDLEFTQALLEDVRSRLKAVPGVACTLYGDYPQAYADSLRIREDLRSSAVTSTLLVSVFLGLSLRRFLDPIFIFIPVVLAIFWTLPIGGALLGPMTPLTISAAAILIGLGVDFSIHYLIRYATERRNEDHPTAIRNTLEAIGRPLLVSMLTTVCAFLSLIVADFSGLRIFGSLLALGLALAFLSSVFVLSLLLSTRSRIRRVEPWSRFTDLLRAVTESRAGKPVAWCLLAAAIVGFAVAAVRGVHFASDLEFLRPDDDAVATSESRFEADLGFAILPAALLLDLSLTGAEIHDGIEQLMREKRVGLAFGRRLLEPTRERRIEVAAFRSQTRDWVAETLEDLERLGFNAEPFRAGLDRFARAFAGDPPAETRAEPIRVGDVPYHLVVCHPRENIQTLAAWEEFESAVHRVFGQNARAFHAQALLREIHVVLLADLTKAALITAVLAVLIVALLTGGLQSGVLVLLPSLCGFGVTLGCLALFDVPLNMANCVSIPLLLGIGVDHGVHLVAHFRRTGRAHPGACGVAIWRSSATTILAFGSLILAQTPGIASLGMISILGVAMCLLTSLLVLPILWRGVKRSDIAGSGPPPRSLARSRSTSVKA